MSLQIQLVCDKCEKVMPLTGKCTNGRNFKFKGSELVLLFENGTVFCKECLDKDKKIPEEKEPFDTKLKKKKVKQKLPKLTFRQLEILGMMKDGQEYCALSLTCSLPTLFALVKKGFVTRRDLAGSGAYPHTKIMFKKVA